MRTGYVQPGTTADPRSAGPHPSSPIYVPRHNSLSMSPTVVKPTNLPLSPKPNARVSIRHSHMGAGGIVPPHKVRYKTAPVSPKANGAAVSPQRRSFVPALGKPTATDAATNRSQSMPLTSPSSHLCVMQHRKSAPLLKAGVTSATICGCACNSHSFFFGEAMVPACRADVTVLSRWIRLACPGCPGGAR